VTSLDRGLPGEQQVTAFHSKISGPDRVRVPAGGETMLTLRSLTLWSLELCSY
jgi:hypothetical protein